MSWRWPLLCFHTHLLSGLKLLSCYVSVGVQEWWKEKENVKNEAPVEEWKAKVYLMFNRHVHTYYTTYVQCNYNLLKQPILKSGTIHGLLPLYDFPATFSRVFAMVHYQRFLLTLLVPYFRRREQNGFVTGNGNGKECCIYVDNTCLYRLTYAAF